MRKAIRLFFAAFVLALSVSTLRAQSTAIGQWDFTTSSPEGEFKSVLVIREEEGELKAYGKNPQGERPYDSVAVEGSKITLVITIPYNGSPMTITYTGKIDAGKMGGEADFGGLATGGWAAVVQKQ
jgi:hypothetical protein